MSDAVLYEQDGHVVVLTINRPDNLNPLTDEDVSASLIDYCERINGDTHVRCAILTGAGRAFSAGGNIKDMRDKKGIFAGSEEEIKRAYQAGIQTVAKSLYGLQVPLIAAVNGPAYGAGCGAALACDIRILSEDAVLAENFVKAGLISGFGGGWLLPRIIGAARAAEMTFTGEPIKADQALAWGLASKVVPGEDLMKEAEDLASRIAVNPPGVLRDSKRLLRAGVNMQFEQLLDLASGYQAKAHHTDDHMEALAAIFEKRRPKFTGK